MLCLLTQTYLWQDVVWRPFINILQEDALSEQKLAESALYGIWQRILAPEIGSQICRNVSNHTRAILKFYSILWQFDFREVQNCRNTVYKAFTRDPDLMKLRSNIIMFSSPLNKQLVNYGTWVESSPVPCIISFIRKRHTCLFTDIRRFFSH